MKFSSFSIFFCLLAVIGCGQHRDQSKDLIGEWHLIDTSDGKMILHFIDKSEVTWNTIYRDGTDLTGKGTYKALPIDDSTLHVTMRINTMGIEQVSECLIRYVDHSKFKFQIAGTSRPLKWEKETNNTSTWIKIESEQK